MARKMKDSGIEWIGEIPEGWSAVKAKYCVEITHGSDPKTEGNIPVYGSGAESFKNCGEYKEGPTVLIGRKGATLHIPHYIEGKYWNVDTAFDVKPKNNFFLRYYYYLATSFDYKFYISQTTLPGMTQSNYYNMFLPFPTLPEQQEISNHLDSECSRIDAMLTKTRASIEEYKKLKQAVITQAVTKGVRGEREKKDSGVEWIGKIASDYTIYKLKHLLREPLKYGANESGVPYSPTLPRYIRITDITLDGKLKASGKLSLTEESAKDYILEDGDILLARSGATVGKSFIYHQSYGRAAYAGYLIKAAFNDNVLPKFVYYFTCSSLYEIWKNSIFIQSTIQNIGADRYANLPLSVPNSLHEQKGIADYLDAKCAEIDALITKKEQLVKELESYKKSLIYEVMTGKREV